MTVFTPAPGGGTSGGRTFTVNAPVPTLTGLSPSSAPAGGAEFTLTVTGTGGTASDVSVRYATSDGTARAGVHYPATSGVVTLSDPTAGATLGTPSSTLVFILGD